MNNPNGFNCNISSPVVDGKNLVTTITLSYPIEGTLKQIPSGITCNVSFDGFKFISNTSSFHPICWTNDEIDAFNNCEDPKNDLQNVDSKTEEIIDEKKSYLKIISNNLKDTDIKPVTELNETPSENMVPVKIGSDFLDMVQSIVHFLPSLKIEDVLKMTFLEEKNKKARYTSFNTIGLIHSILLSLNWNFKQIPPWVIPNCNNYTGFFFDRSKFDDFFKNLNDKEKLYKDNYLRRFLEVMPILKKILQSLIDRNTSVHYDSFLNRQSKYQLCYYCNLVGDSFDRDNDTEDSLKAKINKGINEINTLNKFMFQIVVLSSNECKSKINMDEPKV